jgi:hypothetical protein
VLGEASTLMQSLIQALEQSWENGSPVAGRTFQERECLASVAPRRIKSFTRRAVPLNDHRRQIVDLAKGLASQFERNPKLVGPLIKDYEYIAERMLDVYSTRAQDNA